MSKVLEQITQLRGQEWTVAAKADELGVHRETVSRRHLGKTRPDLVGPVIVALDALSARRRIAEEAPLHKNTPSSGELRDSATKPLLEVWCGYFSRTVLRVCGGSPGF